MQTLSMMCLSVIFDLVSITQHIYMCDIYIHTYYECTNLTVDTEWSPSAISYHGGHFPSDTQPNNQQQDREGWLPNFLTHTHKYSNVKTPTLNKHKSNVYPNHTAWANVEHRPAWSQNESWRTSDPVRQTQWHALHYPNRAWTIPGFVTAASVIIKPANAAGDTVYFEPQFSVCCWSNILFSLRLYHCVIFSV